jgi:hypothetical protein
MNLNEIECEGVDWIKLARDRDNWGAHYILAGETMVCVLSLSQNFHANFT